MDKITIMPQVVVYKNMFSDDDINFILKQIYDSEPETEELNDDSEEISAYKDIHGVQPAERNDGSLIYTWTPWYTFGSKSIWSNNPNTNFYDQKKGIDILTNALHVVHSDYINEWKNKGIWTYDVKKWELDKENNIFNNNLILSNLEILKHKINQTEKYAIGPHTDWHPHRSDEPGPKQILTYTIYLNDDYEGGEVDFVNEQDKCLIAYKPQKGDITIFPSGAPFWHGARAVKFGKNKIFIRAFSMFTYAGDKEWMEGLFRWGPTRWMEIHNENVKQRVDKGIVGRQIVEPGDEVIESSHTLPLFIEKNIYIDGRK